MTAFEGSYKMKFPLLALVRPKMVLVAGPDSDEMHGAIRLFRIRKPLTLIKSRPNELIFQMRVDFFDVDVIVRSIDGDIQGLLDTPIGNFTFRCERLEA